MSVSWQVDQPTENCTQSFLWQHVFNSSGECVGKTAAACENPPAPPPSPAPPTRGQIVKLSRVTKAGDKAESRDGYFWFPKAADLIRDTLLVRVVDSPDQIDSHWGTPLISSDNGSSWHTQKDIQVIEPGATIRQANGSILTLPYYYNFSIPLVAVWNATAIHGTAQVIDVVEGKLVVCSAPKITISGFPKALRPSGKWTDVPDGSGPCPVADLNPTNVVATRDGSGLLAIMQNVLWANTTRLAKDPTDFPSSVVVIKSTNGGYDWEYQSTVPGSRDEATWTRLPDGRIFLVLRDDGPTPQCNWTGGRRSSGALRAFCCAYSTTEGRTWENMTAMRARGDGVPPHSVLPQLRWTKNGVLLLSGGRSGVYLWACASVECIESGEWEEVNLAAYHNAQLQPYDNPPHVSKAVCAQQNGSGWGCAPRFPVSVAAPGNWDSMDNTVYGATTGYLSLETFGEDQFVVCYDVACSGCPNSTEVYCQTGRALKTDDTLTSGASDNNLVQNGGTVSKQRDFAWLRSWPAIDERAIPASNDLQVDVTQAVSSTRVVLQPDKPWEVRMDIASFVTQLLPQWRVWTNAQSTTIHL